MLPMLLWVLCAHLAAGVAAAPAADGDARGFDYFYFVRQWGPSVCMDYKCTRQRIVRDFTIHGLWPEREDGSYPTYCNASEPFDEKSIFDLLPNLESRWQSLMGSDEHFWGHEWSKHGTCCNPIIGTEREYFEIALHLDQAYDILPSLSSFGIVPSSTREYNFSDFAKAINAGLGSDVILHCKKKNLEEVWMCISKDLQPIDCPKAKEKSKSCERIVLPSFSGESFSPSGAGSDFSGGLNYSDGQKYLLARLLITAPSLLLIIVGAVVAAVIIKKRQEVKDRKKATGIVHPSIAQEDQERNPLLSNYQCA